jgi:hypothetical protein
MYNLRQLPAWERKARQSFEKHSCALWKSAPSGGDFSARLEAEKALQKLRNDATLEAEEVRAETVSKRIVRKKKLPRLRLNERRNRRT